MVKCLLFIIATAITFMGIAQNKPVFTTKILDVTATNKVLNITAIAPANSKIISVKYISNDLPINTSIEYDSATKPYLKDSITELGNATLIKNADFGNAIVKGYDTVQWQQNIALQTNDTVRLKAAITYYYTNSDGSINSDMEKLSVQTYATTQANTTITNTATSASHSSLWGIFIAGLVAGLIGFLTPCVYSLVPVTVSMFLKRSKTPKEGKLNIFAYAFFIILIYTSIGLLTGSLFSVNDLQTLSTHWLFNLFIFALFVIFGISFLGAFDINLPNSWANKLDSKASTKSFAGIFFMAFTLVIVSFSCTSIFVSNILTTASIYFGKAGPIVGMFSFGLGLGLPFMILALFPKALTVLTKSGGWQNALKVTLGFLELALALKFLSNVDVYFNWRFLDREVFLVIWIALFALLGIYLLGKIRFKHDSDLPKNDWGLTYIPIPRLFLAIAAFAFAMYLVPGLWGAPLKAVSTFSPPVGRQDFVLTNGGSNDAQTVSAALPPSKYVKRLKINEPTAAKQHNLSIYYDYDEALAAAKILKKPLLLDFTGEQCVNCRKFEAAIWPDATVANLMKNDFVLASLFTDVKEELNDNEKVYDSLLGSKLYTVGDKFKALQLKLIGTQAQPNYVFVDAEGNLLYNQGYGYEPTESTVAFANHLKMILQEFAKRK